VNIFDDDNVLYNQQEWERERGYFIRVLEILYQNIIRTRIIWANLYGIYSTHSDIALSSVTLTCVVFYIMKTQQVFLT